MGDARRVPPAVAEQSAVAGALNGAVLADPERARLTAEYVAKRLDAGEAADERGWQGTADGKGGIAFSRELRAVREHHVIDRSLIVSAEAVKLDAMAGDLQATYKGPAKLALKGGEVEVFGPVALFKAVIAEGRKGLTISRYKGLGEMNPDQLWHTTLDPESRLLLQVRIRDVEESIEIFEKLMGDVVEPRREFIQANALKVVNLDV